MFSPHPKGTGQLHVATGDVVQCHENLKNTDMTHVNNLAGFLRNVLLVAVLLSFPQLTSSQMVNGRFSTSVYVWQKFDTVDVSHTLARGFQTLQLEVAQGDFSIQTSAYAASNFSQSAGDDALGRVNNLFVRWKNIGGALDMNLGRIPVFAGVGNGTVDGALLKARTSDSRVMMTAYGGANVLSDLNSGGFTDLDKKFLLGGQILTTVIPDARVGLSYVNRHIERESYTTIRPDSLFNPTTILVMPDSRAQQAIGVDARYDPDAVYSAYGRYDYDLNSKRSLRGELHARVQATDQFAVTGNFVYREPFVPFNSFFEVFPVSPVREAEGGVEYMFTPSYRAYARYAYVKYVDALSRRVSVGVYTDYASASYSGSSGYAGVLNSFYLQAMYPLLKRMLVPTLGFSYAAYRLSEDNTSTDKMFAGSLGAIVRPVQLVSADIQLQWLHNKVVDRDVRLLAKVNYWFSHNFGLFGQKGAGE